MQTQKSLEITTATATAAATTSNSLESTHFLFSLLLAHSFGRSNSLPIPVYFVRFCTRYAIWRWLMIFYLIYAVWNHLEMIVRKRVCVCAWARALGKCAKRVLFFSTFIRKLRKCSFHHSHQTQFNTNAHDCYDMSCSDYRTILTLLILKI